MGLVLVRVLFGCGLRRGRHEARPLQLVWIDCGRTNVRPYLSEDRVRCGKNVNIVLI